MKTVKRQSPVFGTICTDAQRINAIRATLASGYSLRDRDTILKAAILVQQYVDEGLDDTEVYSEAIDDYTGHNPQLLARQYICHVFLDRYLDDDSDQEYIRTGLKPFMRRWGKQPVQLSLFN